MKPLSNQAKSRMVAGARSSERGARLRQALRGGSESDPIDLNGVQIRFRLLSQAAKDQVWLDCIAAFREQGVELVATTAEQFSADKILRMLAMATIDHESGEPLASYEEWRELGDSVTVQRAWEEYAAFEARNGPDEVVDLNAWLEEARKYVGESGGGLTAYLKTLDFSTLASLVNSMALRLLS